MLDVLQGNIKHPCPVWFMRQAGRYLPEYRDIRQNAGGFLNMVYNPDLACEVTLQPIRRYHMDGAILFSDILIVPHGLGQDVGFVTGEGPKLCPIRTKKDLDILGIENATDKFSKIGQSVEKISQSLRDENFHNTSLIGFAGSPWTIACYMVQGGSSRDFFAVRQLAMEDEKSFSRLIDILVEATIIYLDLQISKGAEIVKLFDSWSGILDEKSFEKWVIEPTQRIVSGLKSIHPDVPVIGFPRLSGVMAKPYAQKTGIDAIAIDQHMPASWAADHLQTILPVQGNLDPCYFLAEKTILKAEIQRIYDCFKDGPFIFNLGHGVFKQANPDVVGLAVQYIREISV